AHRHLLHGHPPPPHPLAMGPPSCPPPLPRPLRRPPLPLLRRPRTPAPPPHRPHPRRLPVHLRPSRDPLTHCRPRGRHEPPRRLHPLLADRGGGPHDPRLSPPTPPRSLRGPRGPLPVSRRHRAHPTRRGRAPCHPHLRGRPRPRHPPALPTLARRGGGRS